MNFADVSSGDLVRRFRHGATWRVGPYVIRAVVPIAFVARQLGFLYQDFPLLEGHHIADAEVSVRRAGFAWRQASIYSDGGLLYRRILRQHVVPLIEWTLNLSVFHRPGLNLLLHAAVVEKAGRAVILPGEAGSGKSTLCAGLIHRGWRLLSDEVAVVRPSDGRVLPVPRPVSLKEGSIEAIRRFAPEARLGPVWPQTAKGSLAHLLPPEESVRRMDEPASPRWIVFPSFQPDADCMLEPLAKPEMLIHCADNAFNYSVLGREGFRTLASVVDVCDGYELIYHDLQRAVDALDRLVVRSGKFQVAGSGSRG